jgi:DNA-binding NarL/FixJ family response regulator
VTDVRVVLVDDHALFRAGVRAELAARVELVGEAAPVEEARRSSRARRAPTSCLLDVHMPDGGGVAVLQRTTRPKVLALSVSDAAEDVIAIIRAGRRGT